jgi:hypothetical protein
MRVFILLSSLLLGGTLAPGCGSSDAPEEKPKKPGTSFSDPTTIDNSWFPLHPGSKYVWRGTEHVDGQRVDHRVVFVVTDLTKRINGVRTRVVWDRDYANGKLSEGELAFMAQDDSGDVWSYGEYPEEWEGKKLAGAPSTWIPGLEGAKPGMLMPAAPRVGEPSYLQGFAPGIQFADRAKATRSVKRMCVPAGCFRNVLVNAEWTPEEPGARQLKYYARGVGSIRVGFTSGTQREKLVLVRTSRLRGSELARLRAGALELDRRGYRVSPKLYGRTPRARVSGSN